MKFKWERSFVDWHSWHKEEKSVAKCKGKNSLVFKILFLGESYWILLLLKLEMFLCKNIQKHLMRRKIACNHEWKMRSLAMNQTIAVNAHEHPLLCGEIREKIIPIKYFCSMISVHCILSRGRVVRFLSWPPKIRKFYSTILRLK